MATLIKRKDRGGKWRLAYTDVDGKRYKVDTGTADKKIAELWLRKVQDLLSQARLGLIEKVGRVDAGAVAGKKFSQSALTLSEFMEKYEQRCKDDLELSKSTIQNNNLAIRSLIESIDDKLLSEITDEDIIVWKQEMLKKGRARTTLAIYFRHLRAAFNRAVKYKMISINPFLQIENIKEEKESRIKNKDIGFEEVQTLLRAIEEADHEFGTYIRFLVLTGCRRTEILFLKWGNIDLPNKTMRVYQEKTKREIEIPINKALMKVIEGMEKKESGYVFQSKSYSHGAKNKEQPWNKDFVSHRFKSYIRALGLPEHYTLHSLRHTYSNILLRKGVSLEIVQKLLGHSSVRTTADNYDHTIALHFRQQADLVDFEEQI